MNQLDEWIFDNLNCTGSNQSPTRDPAAAMEVLKKCAARIDGTIRIGECAGRWLVMPYLSTPDELRDDFPTLELAICLFAKKLFNH